MDIRFSDHASFHRAAAGMVGGAVVSGLALHPITPLAPLVGGLAGLAVGTAWGYGRPTWRVLAAAAAAVPLFVMTPGWTAMAVVAAVMALGLAMGGKGAVTGVRGAVAVALGAVTTMLGMWCALRVLGARETQAWSQWALTATAAGSMGMVGILAMLPRHLKVAIDPVMAAVRRLPANLDAEVKGLCDRSVAIWSTAKDRISDDAGRNLVRDGVVKTLEVAVKSADVRVTGSTDTELQNRMAELDKRVAAATDDEVRTQYQAARAALEDQRRYREHIAKGRERLVARMHNHVAALEKFQLAATGLEAARAATAGATAIQQLEELSHDVAASGEALAEIELGELTAVTAKPEAKPEPTTPDEIAPTAPAPAGN
ncbi:MAG: hypothetical protein H0T89_28995 [Deltaproteobacteria bacterium]|nr:hypothetical protein [Deltaproteobacteria bacterium]MDQ3299499.1 hypothetical protein [Myxococcota bacterium]